MKDDIQADIAAVDSQGSPLEQSWRTNSKMMRDKRLRERQNEGIEGIADEGSDGETGY